MIYALLCIIGLAGGTVIAGGVFALITSTKLMSRLAGKTHTGGSGRLYEDAVLFGGILFNALYVFGVQLRFLEKYANFALAFFGIFAGIFVGCLAISLAEALKSTAIFSRRTKLSMGLSFIVLSAALGKMIGVIYQFFVIK